VVERDVTPVYIRAIWTAVGAIILLWFLAKFTGTFILFFFALVLAIAMNGPVAKLERRRVPRWAGTALVCLGVVAVAALLIWLVVPRLTEQLTVLAQNLPTYAQNLSREISGWFAGYPSVQQRLQLNGATAAAQLPSAMDVVSRVGRVSLSLLELIFALVVLASAVVYLLVDPKPLLRGYVLALPEPLRDAGVRAFARASRMVVGWMWSNIVVGAVEAVAASIFLSLMHVPGALVWGAFAFFAELVPRIGGYIMATPPVLVALSVDPVLAIWVALFYLVLNEAAGNLIAPVVRGSTMEIHPVVVLFYTIAMATAFGLVGALIATPLAAFVKAYYDEFYLARRAPPEHLEASVTTMLERAPERH